MMQKQVLKTQCEKTESQICGADDIKYLVSSFANSSNGEFGDAKDTPKNTQKKKTC